MWKLVIHDLTEDSEGRNGILAYLSIFVFLYFFMLLDPGILKLSGNVTLEE